MNLMCSITFLIQKNNIWNKTGLSEQGLLTNILVKVKGIYVTLQIVLPKKLQSKYKQVMGAIMKHNVSVAFGSAVWNTR